MPSSNGDTAHHTEVLAPCSGGLEERIQLALLVVPAQRRLLVHREMPLQRRADAARVHGEGAHAAPAAERVEVQGEQGVDRLGLRVGGPLVVVAAHEVRIGEVEPAARMSAGRERHHAGLARGHEQRPEPRRQLEVAEMVGGELALVAARIPGQRTGHDGGVVHEQIERPGGGGAGRGKRVDRRRQRQIEREDLDLSRHVAQLLGGRIRTPRSPRSPWRPAPASARTVSLPTPE